MASSFSSSAMMVEPAQPLNNCSANVVQTGTTYGPQTQKRSRPEEWAMVVYNPNQNQNSSVQTVQIDTSVPPTLKRKRGRKSRSEERAIVVYNPDQKPDWLPKGWRMEVKVRTGGKTAGSYDRFYFCPKNYRFRSRPDVLKYVMTGIRPGASSKRKRTEENNTRVNATPSTSSSSSYI